MMPFVHSKPEVAKDDDLGICVSAEPDSQGMHIKIENTSKDKPFEFQMANIPFVTIMPIITDSKGERISMDLPLLPSGTRPIYETIPIAPGSQWEMVVPFSQILDASRISLFDVKEPVRWHLAVVVARDPIKIMHLVGYNLYLDKAGIAEETSIKYAELPATSVSLNPKFVTPSDSNIIVTSVEPFPLGFVQLVGHPFKQSKESYLSGINLEQVPLTAKQIASTISLLENNLVLGYERESEDAFSIATSSLANPKKVSIAEISHQISDSQKSGQSITFEKFIASHAIFFKKAIAFQGQAGMESMVQVMDRKLSPDTGIIISARQLSGANLQVVGYCGCGQWAKFIPLQVGI